MLPNAKKYYTPEEYLALEEKAEYKSEYYQGEIFAMAGGSYNHTVISVNLIIALGSAFASRRCIVFNSDMKVLVEANGLYTYPDISAVCGAPGFVANRTDVITNPILIIEVLSDSTSFYDRNNKFALYRALSSLEDYVLIDQKQVLVEYYRRTGSRSWSLETYESLEEVVKLEAVEVELSLSQIYHKVIFPSPHL